MNGPRNIVEPEDAERNRAEGGYTFHAPLDCPAGSPALTVAAVRVGDHAHVHVESGTARTRRPRENEFMAATRGFAGKLVLRWPEWLIFRDLLAADGRCHVVEVERPTPGQAERYMGDRPTT